MARKGTRNLAPDRSARRAAPDRGAPAPEPQEQWIDEGPVRDEAAAAVARGGASPARRGSRSAASRDAAALPGDVAGELVGAVGSGRAPRLEARLRDAAEAYSAERYRDARRLLASLAETAPDAPSVRELHGLTLYRMGRWREAIRELEAFEQLTDSVDQHPVVADCRRALGQRAAVERLWDELRRGGASAEVLAEGRIVTAAARADGGDLRGAIALLEDGPVRVKKPKDHHLRLWYALASLYERAGDVPRARELFRRIIGRDADFADAEARYDALA